MKTGHDWSGLCNGMVSQVLVGVIDVTVSTDDHVPGVPDVLDVIDGPAGTGQEGRGFLG